MENEFIPYEQALALKKLGFDEPCFDFYDDDKELFYLSENEGKIHIGDGLKAPLYQQAFRWFREKYKLDYYINPHYKVNGGIAGYMWDCSHHTNSELNKSGSESSYEEAQLECLKKLIEIIKKK